MPRASSRRFRRLLAGIGRAEEALQAAAQILRANQEWLGVFRASFDEADGGSGRKSGEEIFVAGGIEVLAAVEFEHGDRIYRKCAYGRRSGEW